MHHQFTGKPLIAWIKAWQNALNEQASRDTLVAFNMNSYVIAVLVIFYLQVNHELPTVTELGSAIESGMKISIKQSLEEFSKGFFDFYGHKFEITTHMISLHVSKGQQKVQKGCVYEKQTINRLEGN